VYQAAGFGTLSFALQAPRMDPNALAEHPLEPLFRPRSIAVVGASTSQGPGGGFVTSIQEMGFQGALYPVNPKAEEIAGLKCYPSLLEVPGGVDYVISSVPARVVPQLIEDSAAKGAGAVHFFTAGFSETGEAERAKLEQQILVRARELGLRLIGPNCMGLYCPEAGLGFMPGMPKEPGPVGMVSQSGANAGEFCRSAGARGLRYSKVISYGNALDLDESDFLDYLAQDAATELIAGYIEGVKDGRRFLAALRRAASAKPVVVLKGGRTEAGGRATLSHTASLAGALEVFDAACRQAGALRVDDMDELVDTAVALRFVRDLAGPRVGVVGAGGGHSVLAADAVAAAGLEVPPLPEETQRALGEFTPIAGTSVRNPVDTNVAWGPEGQHLQRETLRLVAEAPNIDVIFFQGSVGWRRGPSDQGPDPVEQAKQLALTTADMIAQCGKPIVVPLMPPMSAEGADAVFAFRDEAAALGIATFPSVSRAARALRRVLDWRALRA
jgi:acyl-CoA synthetase (NDP forming)